MIDFGDIAAFIDELERDAELVDRRIVRIAYRREPGGPGTYSHVSLVATAKVRAFFQDHNGRPVYHDVVRLTKYIGEDWGDRFPVTTTTHERAAEVENNLKQELELRGFEIRGGVLS